MEGSSLPMDTPEFPQASLPPPVFHFLESHITLTLATVGQDGEPAAAALFYALMPDGRLLFLSDPATRHVQHLLYTSRVAITVQRDGQDWRRIQGLQGAGEAYALAPARWLQAWHVYTRRFPFVKDAGARAGDPNALAGPLARARWYTIHLDWVRLIDNRRGFGWKAEWQRTDRGWHRTR